jgi:hypothetical protein
MTSGEHLVNIRTDSGSWQTPPRSSGGGEWVPELTGVVVIEGVNGAG